MWNLRSPKPGFRWMNACRKSKLRGISARQEIAEGSIYKYEKASVSSIEKRSYRFFFCPKSAPNSSPLSRTRRDFTSSRSMLISLSKAFALASAMRFSSSISNRRFCRSLSSALIRSIVPLKLLIRTNSEAFEWAFHALKTFALKLRRKGRINPRCS